MIDWLRWLGILPIKLFFPLDGKGALVCPVAFILTMEKTEWNFLSSLAVVPSAYVVSFFAMVMIIAIGSFLVAVPFAFSPVMVSGVSRFFFGNVVHYSFVLRFISVPWF